MKEKVYHIFILQIGIQGFKELRVLAQAVKLVVRQDLKPDLQGSYPGLFHVGLRDQYYLLPDGDTPLCQAQSILRNHIIQTVLDSPPSQNT